MREIISPPAYDEIGRDEPVDPELVATNFTQIHTFSPSFQQYKPLPAPVILPQRRPKNKTRGFVRAYAPLLGECSGIDADTFIDFLGAFDKTSKASPVFDVINMAAMVTGFVPSPIAMGVSMTVQFAANTGKEVQSRYRRNNFLDEMNEKFFKPRGLFCMIMTFKPDAAPVIAADVTSTDQALAQTLSLPDSELKQKFKHLRLTSGTTKGEMSLPEAAPLVFPALDGAMTDEAKAKKLDSSTAFICSYFDRRARSTLWRYKPQFKACCPASRQTFCFTLFRP